MGAECFTINLVFKCHVSIPFIVFLLLLLLFNSSVHFVFFRFNKQSTAWQNQLQLEKKPAEGARNREKTKNKKKPFEEKLESLPLHHTDSLNEGVAVLYNRKRIQAAVRQKTVGFPVLRDVS